MSNAFRIIYLIAGVLLLNACSSTRPGIHQEPLPGWKPAIKHITLPKQDVDQQLAELARIQLEDRDLPTLGRGDIINISVYDEPDLAVSGIPIRPDGRISFPLAGDVQAEGLTVNQLQNALTNSLSDYIHSPKVSVIVQEFISQQFTIFGEVVHPGVFPLKTSVSITEALAGAGGLNKGQFRATSVELADLSHAFIARNGKVLPVDFVRLIRYGDLRYDISLESGDYIYIPSGLSQEIYILGEVNQPMLFAYREDMPMSRTLAQAGGFTPDADLKRIHIVRGTLHNPTVIMINFKEVLKGRAREVPLEPGDIVYVPPTGMTRFSRVVDKIMPSIQAIQTGLILSGSNAN